MVSLPGFRGWRAHISIVTQGKKAGRCWTQSLCCPWEARQRCMGMTPLTLALSFLPRMHILKLSGLQEGSPAPWTPAQDDSRG